MRKKWLIVLVSMGLVVAACGGDDDDGASTEAPATEAPGTTAAAGTTAAPGTTSGSESTEAPATTGGVAATTSAPAPSGDPVHVLGLFPLTGPIADLGKAFEGGAAAAVEAVNNAGGILGRPVEMKVLDTGGDPTKTLSLFQGELAGGSKPSLVLCSTSPECLAIAPAATQEGIVSFSQSASAVLNDPSTFPYHFGTSANLELQLGIGLDYLKPTTQRLTLVTTNDALGTTFADATKKVGAEKGIEVTVQLFNPTDVDLTSTLEKAKGDDPDTMLFNMNGPPIGYAFSARHKVGLDDVPVLGWNSLATFETAKLVPEEERPNTVVEAINVQVYADPAERSPEFNAFFEAVKQQAGGEITLSLGSYAYHWDAVWAFALAAEEAQSIEAADVQTALESFEDPADSPMVIYDPMRFSDVEHFAIPSPSDYQFVPIAPFKDGMLDVP